MCLLHCYYSLYPQQYPNYILRFIKAKIQKLSKNSSTQIKIPVTYCYSMKVVGLQLFLAKFESINKTFGENVPEQHFSRAEVTAQKMKFSIKNFFSKCDQISSFLRSCSHLLKKTLMENFIFCAVIVLVVHYCLPN